MKLYCSICMGSIRENGVITPCEHGFHLECVKKWIWDQETCPNCREKVLITDLNRLIINIPTKRVTVGPPVYVKKDEKEAYLKNHSNPQQYPDWFTQPLQEMLSQKLKICHLRRSDSSKEYGFSFCTKKNNGHFIGRVDKGGIGEHAGLEPGHRIVGVNGRFIKQDLMHKDLSNLLKENLLEIELIVA